MFEGILIYFLYGLKSLEGFEIFFPKPPKLKNFSIEKGFEPNPLSLAMLQRPNRLIRGHDNFDLVPGTKKSLQR